MHLVQKPSIVAVGGFIFAVYLLSVLFPMCHAFCLIGAGLNVLLFVQQEGSKDLTATLDIQLESLFRALSHAVVGYFLSILLIPYAAYRLTKPKAEWGEFTADVVKLFKT